MRTWCRERASGSSDQAKTVSRDAGSSSMPDAGRHNGTFAFAGAFENAFWNVVTISRRGNACAIFAFFCSNRAVPEPRPSVVLIADMSNKKR